MRAKVFLLTALIKINFLFAQSDFDKIYSIFQQKCVICHSNNSPDGGLDLEGEGANPKYDVYSKIFDIKPINSTAEKDFQKLIKPYDPYRSAIFRKINWNYDDYIILSTGEGANMPPTFSLSDYEKEFIRQWILSGASFNFNKVDTLIIKNYLSQSGSFLSLNNVPPTPKLDEGFQMKIGPYLVAPGKETDKSALIELPINDTIEVIKIESYLGAFTHHFVIYHDDPVTEFKLFTVSQLSDTIELPYGTAFIFPNGKKMRFNPHHTNFDFTNIMGGVNYINIYYQNKGIAAQEMKTEMIHFLNLEIPNDGLEYHFQSDFFNEDDTTNYYIWNAASHTHQLGKSFRIYTRDDNGDINELIFDGHYKYGDPNNLYIGYDYRHPQIRTWEYPFKEIRKKTGISFLASYINNGADTIYYGPTASDEMMAAIIMYVEDTTGLRDPFSKIENEIKNSLIKAFPNPSFSGSINFKNYSNHSQKLKICSVVGGILSELELKPKEIKTIWLEKGVYFYLIENYNSGKIVIY